MMFNNDLFLNNIGFIGSGFNDGMEGLDDLFLFFIVDNELLEVLVEIFIFVSFSFNLKRDQIVFSNIVKIKVIGVGGGGCNVVNCMIVSGVMGIDFWVINIDFQVLINMNVLDCI